jgi:hypothetical protein
MTFLVWLAIIAFVGGAVARIRWVSRLYTKVPPFRTEDHADWLRHRHGLVD